MFRVLGTEFQELSTKFVLMAAKWQYLPNIAILDFDQIRVNAVASINISLPEQMRDWVQSQIETGSYSSSSDYVRDLIRKDQERRDKVAALQRAIDKGIASGAAEDFSFSDFKKRMQAKK
jgi:antitoxin ParD1/3/4